MGEGGGTAPAFVVNERMNGFSGVDSFLVGTTQGGGLVGRAMLQEQRNIQNCLVPSNVSKCNVMQRSASLYYSTTVYGSKVHQIFSTFAFIITHAPSVHVTMVLKKEEWCRY